MDLYKYAVLNLKKNFFFYKLWRFHQNTHADSPSRNMSEGTLFNFFFGPWSESQTTIKLSNETLPSVVLSFSFLT